MIDTVVVQRISSSDAAAFANALKVVREVVGPEGDLDTSEHIAHLTRALATPNCYVFVASLSGMPIGYVTAYRFPRLDHTSDQAYVFDIEVAERMRRLGVGRHLLETLLTTCWAEGVTWAWAGTARENLAAQRLFSVAGGARVGETYVEYHFDAPVGR